MSNHIIIADDHPLFRDAIAQLLARHFTTMQVTQVESMQGLCNTLKAEALPTLVLLDLKLPDTQGMESVLRLKKEFPALPVLIVSAYDDNNVIHMAMQYGASGFIPKSLSMDKMADVIQQILDGDMWFPEINQDANQASREGFEELTAVQLKVLSLLRDGKPSKEMASILSVTESTIKAHLTVIFRKLGVRNRTQAVLAARELDLPKQSI